MRFLIDGYNLMHALGLAPTAGLSLERSRLRFLDWIAVEIGKRSHDVTVVFDSTQTRGGNESVYRGIRLVFANARTADDLIEEWVQAETAPATLTVVSNDHRLQSAARRRGCITWTCGEYVDWLQSETKPAKPAPQSAEKPVEPSDDEMADWLRRFGS